MDIKRLLEKGQDSFAAIVAGRRSAHTVLFVTEVKTFRIDCDSKGVVIGDVEQIEVGCKSPGQLAKAFNTIAETTRPLGRKTWLLYLRLTALQVSLPTMQIKDVDHQTLLQALQFEAEGLTGISTLDSLVAYHFLKAENEMTDYWLILIDQLVWQDVLKTAKMHKTKLAGLLHPGAMPKFIQNSSLSDWLRVEAWSTSIIAVCRNHGQTTIQALNKDNPHWKTELDQWLKEIAEQGDLMPSEGLTNNRMELLPDTDYVFKLNQQGSDLGVWLSLWAQCLIAERGEETAVLRPVSQINLDVVWPLASGVAALLLCGSHAVWFVHQRAYYEEQSARLGKMESLITDMNKKLSEGNEQKKLLETKLNKMTEDVGLVPNAIRRLQQRPALLLQVLAYARQEKVILESFESKLDGILLEGFTLQQQLSNQLASNLAANLQDLYWKVEMPTIKNMNLYEGEPGPWSYKIQLTDTGIPSLVLPDSDKKDAKN
jgi:hypothetical protein